MSWKATVNRDGVREKVQARVTWSQVSRTQSALGTGPTGNGNDGETRCQDSLLLTKDILCLRQHLPALYIFFSCISKQKIICTQIPPPLFLHRQQVSSLLKAIIHVCLPAAFPFLSSDDNLFKLSSFPDGFDLDDT